MPAPRNGDYVQVYGRKKTATAVALCKAGKGLIKVNGRPLDKIEPEALRLKLQEPLLVCGAERFSAIDIKIKVSGGGRVAQIYRRPLRARISRKSDCPWKTIEWDLSDLGVIFFMFILIFLNICSRQAGSFSDFLPLSRARGYAIRQAISRAVVAYSGTWENVDKLSTDFERKYQVFEILAIKALNRSNSGRIRLLFNFLALNR